ncbi:hypothetical protein [Campylobacter estrildidarum]|uniref:Uncharacterized protein n=1 Tax=Campylobacter estrildidarum TaxID=2510189 RepID=A0A4V6DW89_9BACT|nr:hypothetical protein [Campylobacter estrildidarum]TKX31152.1 hypothetical protein CQA69_04255 [Campylobacter estrildidarum]
MLPLILGIGAIGYAGVKLKKWYDQTKEENAYWIDSPKDVISEMICNATKVAEEKIDALDDKALKIFDKIDEILYNKVEYLSSHTSNLNIKEDLNNISKEQNELIQRNYKTNLLRHGICKFNDRRNGFNNDKSRQGSNRFYFGSIR